MNLGSIGKAGSLHNISSVEEENIFSPCPHSLLNKRFNRSCFRANMHTGSEQALDLEVLNERENVGIVGVDVFFMRVSAQPRVNICNVNKIDFLQLKRLMDGIPLSAFNCTSRI